MLYGNSHLWVAGGAQHTRRQTAIAALPCHKSPVRPSRCGAPGRRKPVSAFAPRPAAFVAQIRRADVPRGNEGFSLRRLGVDGHLGWRMRAAPIQQYPSFLPFHGYRLGDWVPPPRPAEGMPKVGVCTVGAHTEGYLSSKGSPNQICEGRKRLCCPSDGCMDSHSSPV
jgi:hypothetical protein